MFKNRADAGMRLAKLLKGFKDQDVIVYALPRGGVIVGAEIAKVLKAPLDLIIARKIGHPRQPEYAIGAIAENGHSVFNEQVVNIDEDYITTESAKQKEEAKRRRKIYLAGRKSIPCEGKIAILVDDGIATGLTMKAAIHELKMHYHPSKIVVAVPVVPAEMVEQLQKAGVGVMAVEIPETFRGALGAYYQDFSPVADEEILKILK